MCVCKPWMYSHHIIAPVYSDHSKDQNWEHHRKEFAPSGSWRSGGSGECEVLGHSRWAVRRERTYKSHCHCIGQYRTIGGCIGWLDGSGCSRLRCGHTMWEWTYIEGFGWCCHCCRSSCAQEQSEGESQSKGKSVPATSQDPSWKTQCHSILGFNLSNFFLKLLGQKSRNNIGVFHFVWLRKPASKGVEQCDQCGLGAAIGQPIACPADFQEGRLGNIFGWVSQLYSWKQ